MSTTSPPLQPKTEEQIHYENLKRYFLWAISITGTFIAVIAGFAIFVTYNDRNAMREEYSKSISDLKAQIAEIKNDATQSAKAIKDDARESVRDTKEYAQSEISHITTSTNEIALREAQRQIDAIFATTKIQDLIENQAVKEIKNKLPEIINAQTRNEFIIHDLADKMRQGFRDAADSLKSFFLNSRNPTDSFHAKELYDEITAEFQAKAEIDGKSGEWQIFTNDSTQFPFSIYQRQVLFHLMKSINNDPTEDLTHLALDIKRLSLFFKKDFRWI